MKDTPYSVQSLFSFKDIVWVWRKYKQSIRRTAWMTGGIFLGISLLFPLKYQIKATFQEHSEKKGGEKLAQLLMTGGESPQASILLKSDAIIRPVVEKLGLQITLNKRLQLGSFFRRAYQNIYAEMQWPIEQIKEITFRDVTYEGTTKQSFRVYFLDETSYAIQGFGLEVKGKVGESVVCGPLTLTLKSRDASVPLQTWVSCLVMPWMKTVETLRKALTISNQKSNASLYYLNLSYSKAQLGAEILNELMGGYRIFLQKDHDQVAAEQLAYLRKRQDQLAEQLDDSLVDQMKYLKQHIGKAGFVNSQQEMRSFLKSYTALFHQLFSNEVEMERLSVVHPSGKVPLSSLQPHDPAYLFCAQIRDLEGERNLLELALSMRNRETGTFVEPREDLQALRADIRELQAALKDMEKGIPLSASFQLFHDPQSIVKNWAEEIALQGASSEDLVEYLNYLTRNLAAREKICQERRFFNAGHTEQLEGIDYQTIQQLLVQTSQALDLNRASRERYQHFLPLVKDPSFSLSPLGEILPDAGSQKILHEAIQLQLKLQESDALHPKEQERLARSLALRRHLLHEHLRQWVDVADLQCSLYQDKLSALKQLKLDHVNSQISVLEEKLKDWEKQRVQALKKDRELTEKRMADLRGQMERFPEQWRREQLLNFKKLLGLKTMQSVVQLVEAKTIEKHTHQVTSKPIDKAYPPLDPCRPYLLVSGLLGMFFGGATSFGRRFARHLTQGFPANEEKLLLLKYSLVGGVASQEGRDDLFEEDLETFRAICWQADKHQKILLAQSKGPRYARALASHWAKTGMKIVLVECDFCVQSVKEDRPGLLQYLLGEEAACIPRESQAKYHFVPSGGYTRFGAELLQSPKFHEWVENLAKQYDKILFCQCAPLFSMDARVFLKIVEIIFATVTDEPLLVMESYREEAEKNNILLKIILVSN